MSLFIIFSKGDQVPQTLLDPLMALLSENLVSFAGTNHLKLFTNTELSLNSSKVNLQTICHNLLDIKYVRGPNLPGYDLAPDV